MEILGNCDKSEGNLLVVLAEMFEEFEGRGISRNSKNFLNYVTTFITDNRRKSEEKGK